MCGMDVGRCVYEVCVWGVCMEYVCVYSVCIHVFEMWAQYSNY